MNVRVVISGLIDLLVLWFLFLFMKVQRNTVHYTLQSFSSDLFGFLQPQTERQRPFSEGMAESGLCLCS